MRPIVLLRPILLLSTLHPIPDHLPAYYRRITPDMMGPCDGLLPQPAMTARFKLALIEYKIPKRPSGVGGTDKGKNGHRVDSIPIANGVIKTGNACIPFFYAPEKHAVQSRIVKCFDGIIVRINPGQLSAVDQAAFDGLMRECMALGIPVWSSPDVQIQMGAKDALCKIAHLNCGLPDTLAYYDSDSFITGFKKTMAYQPRVIKQNRGSSGEGIWIVKLKTKGYCAHYGDASLADGDMLEMIEANDNHREFHTVGEFIEWCIKGRAGGKCGTWTSKGTGAYLAGGKAAGGQLIDQRFCPRIVEGEVRVLTSGSTCLQLIHKKPAEGGISAVLGTGSTYTFYGPDEPKYAELKRKLFDEDLPKIMPALGLEGEPFPIVWTTDLIPYTGDDGSDQYTVGEFNCSCVGISKFQACAYPDKSILDVKGFDLAEATMVADTAGAAAVALLEEAYARKNTYHAKVLRSIAGQGPWASLLGPCDGLLKQPVDYKHKALLIEYRVPDHPSGVGGNDKGKNGHRVDSIPMANGVVKTGNVCMPVFYVPALYDAFTTCCKKCDALIVRIAPGQLAPDEQARFDALMRECVGAGIPVWALGINGAGEYKIGEFKSTSSAIVDIPQFQAYAQPNKGLEDVTGADLEIGTRGADAVGAALIDFFGYAAKKR